MKNPQFAIRMGIRVATKDIIPKQRRVQQRKPAKKYFCPMCTGVESDQPGSCPKCSMALERNSACRAPAKTVYTCPMDPQIEQRRARRRGDHFLKLPPWRSSRTLRGLGSPDHLMREAVTMIVSASDRSER